MPPTLSLCVISCAKDAQDLSRCLKSFQSSLIDEICITDTSQEPSDQIKAVCETYGAQYSYKKFEDDFSAVRNFNFDQVTSSHILWVDSDDTISPEALNRLISLKPKFEEFDVWIFDYVYAFTAEGKPALVLPRERVVRNCPEIRWCEPVHECLSITSSKMIRVDIPIEHHRSRGGSPERNLRILKTQADAGTLSERGKFYYGKELFDVGRQEEGVKVFEAYLESSPGRDFNDNIATASIKLSQYYAIKDNHPKAKYYALKSIQFSNKYAEPLFLIAELYESEGKLSTALSYYKECLSKKMDAGMSQLPVFYHFLPHRALALLYDKQGDTQNARKHAIIALSYQPDETLKPLAGEPVDTTPRVAWLFPGNADPVNGSQRIRRINIHKALQDSRIIENYHSLPFATLVAQLSDRNIIVFQNFCEPDYWLMHLLHKMGKKTIFDDCEMISGYPWQTECMTTATAVTCCGTVLAQYRASQGCQRVAVIPDAWEPTQGSPVYDRKELRAIFIGMGGNSFLASSWLRSTVEAAGYKLIVCTEWENADVRWNMDTWAQTMYDCDVILCPQRVDVQPGKSNVKVTQAMSMGLPVIASPLRAYQEIIKHGDNGYIADTLADWGKALEALKDPAVRKRIGEAGRASVDTYSIESVSKRWITMAQDILAIKDEVSTVEPARELPAPKQEPIDIIIPVYNNWEYLRLTLDSILMNTLIPFRVIISDAGSNEEMWMHLRGLKGFTILGAPERRLNFAEACNAGILQSQSRFFVILNSDVIVSKGWLGNMLDKMLTKGRLSSCGVLSNCDLGWLHGVPGKPSYNMTLGVTGKKLNLGCGNKRIEGYINCDVVKIPEVDEVFNFYDIPYGDDTIAAISSEHALEHVSHEKTKLAIREWYRVLKPGGELNLKIPDLELCAERYTKADNSRTVNGYPEKTWYKMTIYGAQTPENGSDAEHQYHLTGFCKDEIKELLESTGFEVITVKNYDGWGTPSIEVIARKPGTDSNNLLLRPGMTMDQIKPHLDELYAYMNQSNVQHKGEFVEQEWVAAYCTMYARSAVNEMGLFDTEYKNGCEDLDLERRLKAGGYKSGQAIDAFVFHFGGVSRGAYKEEGTEKFYGEDKFNHEKYAKKWAKQRVAIYTGPAWEPWTPEDVEAGMAGSETWAVYISREFVALGYDTTVYGHLQDPENVQVYDGVRYVDHRKMLEDCQYIYHDLFISSRTVEPIKHPIHAIKHHVMIHDVFLHPDPNHDVEAWRTQRYYYLSKWHKEFLLSHHRNMPEDKMVQTANGVADYYWMGYDDVPVKTNSSVYSSSPDRGLYQLLMMLPEIRIAVPSFTLHICYGFFNWESAAKQRNDVKSLELIGKIKELLEQPGVEYHGRVSKKELFGLQRKAKVWLFPTWFDETFCCHPENMISTKKGHKRIIDISMSDSVLTHMNRYRRIEQIMSRKYVGNLISLRVGNHSYTGKYTPEHPVLYMKSNFKDKRVDIKSGLIEEWVSIGDIKVGDWVCTPYPDEDNIHTEYCFLDDMKRINRNYKEIGEGIGTRDVSSLGHKQLPKSIPINADFARFLGLYMAEGSFSGGRICFSFNVSEADYIQFVQRYLKDTFGYESEVKNQGNCSNVYCYANALGHWIKHIFGGTASVKDVPYFVFEQSKEFIKYFIMGVLDGDGNFGSNEYKIELSTKTGIMNLKMIMNQVGLHPNYHESCKKGQMYYRLGISISLWEDVFGLDRSTEESYKTYIERDGKLFYRVKDICYEEYDGYVYNLEVEEDHSYTSNFMAVHNCITAIENRLCKNPIITTGKGGLLDTAGAGAVLLSPDGLTRDGEYPESYTKPFIEEAIKLLTDGHYREYKAAQGYDGLNQYQWHNIADRMLK